VPRGDDVPELLRQQLCLLTDVFTGWACDYLAERAKVGGPFLLYLAYNAPHDPIQPPPECLEKVKQRAPGMSEKRAKLVALIEHLDAGIGKVLDTLDWTGLATNTLVIFTSDNGGVLANGANNGPWRGEKQHMYEGGLRVPCMVRWPGVINPGSRTERMTLTMDIFATVCEAAGVTPPKGIDGVSFLPALIGKEQSSSKRDLYFVRREEPQNAQRTRRRAAPTNPACRYGSLASSGANPMKEIASLPFLMVAVAPGFVAEGARMPDGARRSAARVRVSSSFGREVSSASIHGFPPGGPGVRSQSLLRFHGMESGD
jgi:hypothetical protein